MMRDANELSDQVAAIFADKLNLNVSDNDIDLFQSGALDSLSFVNLLLQLETEFGVTVSLDDLELENFSSIGRIAEFIEHRSNGTGDHGNVRALKGGS